MITIKNKADCSGCFACAAICPKKCVQSCQDEEGFAYPLVDESECIRCGMCIGLCDNPVVGRKTHEIVSYSATAKSDDVRLASSSGGIFSIISKYIFYKHGVVYGAAMDENATVEHVRVTDEAGLTKLRRSKYVQSRMGDIYNLVEDDLKNERWVLFSGSPCHIGGLKNFLSARGQSDEFLLCLDLICNGVPPQNAFRKYLNDLGFIGNVDEVNFRDKTNGWQNFSMRIRQGNRTYIRNFRRDSYGMAVLADIMQRPSCYCCKYTHLNYASDLTLADFWGIDKVVPTINADLGVSLVLTHSAKGEQAINASKPFMELVQVQVEDAVRGNSKVVDGHMAPHVNRNVFLAQLHEKNFQHLAVKYIKGGYIRWLLGFVKRRASRIIRRV